MDYKVGAAIYNKPWLIEPDSAINLLNVWEMVQGGGVEWRSHADTDREGFDNLRGLFSSSFTVFAPVDSYEARGFKGFEGAQTAVIRLSGPLMKADFCGDFGTASLLNMFRLAERSSTVQSIVLLVDSPGGTVDGTESFATAVKASRKATVAVVDGMCCSAAYWIASACDEIISTSRTNMIGSIGTMMAFRDSSKADEQRGVVVREFYATASRDKNRAISEAIKGDPKLLIKELLDPTNDEFLSSVRVNREGKLSGTEDVLTGKVYLSEAAKTHGLIDSIGSFEQAVSRSVQLAQYQKALNTPQNMAFEKTLMVAVAASFAVVEGGFLLQEDHLNNIEAALELNATTAASDKATIESLRTQLASSTETIKGLNASLKDSTDQLTAANAKIDELNKRAPGFRQTSKDADPPPIAASEDDAEFLTEADKELAERRQALGLK